jgi:coproporphyrinogen III oxidase
VALLAVQSLQQDTARFVGALQDEISAALESLDGTARFREDRWTREGGGGGTTRILEDGSLFEKAGVNTSVVHGEFSEAFARRLPGEGRRFFAAGISLVLHPANPFVPTVHANLRFIVHGDKAWFGGGADLTPYYLFEEDASYFHRTLKAACDRHDLSYYARFKRSCDEYFRIKHRGETRGVGGIFFEDMGGDLQREFAFVQDCGRSLLPAYVPIATRRRTALFGDAHKKWQEIRRGRYAEFNLLYDRGTAFGLETGGRVEPILMSLPPRARWVYNHQPSPGSDEARLVEVLQSPRDWA